MTKHLPLVSIVMPVYNSAKYLKEAINSILTQTYVNIELIILDDGSTDNSMNIIKSIDSPKIRFLQNKENLGVSATRNKGIDLSKGKYIALMDSDDISPFYRIEKQVDFLQKNNDYGLVGGHYESFSVYPFFIKRKLRKMCVIDEKIKVKLNFLGAIAGGSVMIRKEILEKNMIRFDTNLKIAEDYDMWRRIGKVTKVANLDYLLIHYRKHQFNSIKNKELVDNNMTLALRKSLDDLNISVDDLFSNNQKLKSLDSFSMLLNRFEKYLELNNKEKEKKFDSEYLYESLFEVTFWLYKRHLDLFGYELFEEYKKTIFFKYEKFRFRDKVSLYKIIIKRLI